MDKVFTTVGIFVVAALLFVAPIVTGVSFALNLNGGLRAFSCLFTVSEYLLISLAATYDNIVTSR
jgi:hypothetical protein